MPEILRREVLSEWEKRISERYQSLTGHREEKNRRNQKSSWEDKAFTQWQTNSNKSKTNKENVSSTEENSNNINEERRDTHNPRRYNSYNYNHYRSQNKKSRCNFSINYYYPQNLKTKPKILNLSSYNFSKI